MIGPGETNFQSALLHELNQPLTTLRNILELTTYRETNDWPAVVEAAMASVERMVELLELMGDLNRLERGLEPAGTVDIAELLREALDDLGVSAQENGCHFKGEGVNFPIWVEAPAGILRPMLFRILGDAIQHTPIGRTVAVVLLDTNPVELHIVYSGIAFSANEAETLVALAQTGHGPRGGVTRRVFRMALFLRMLKLHEIGLELKSNSENSVLLLKLRAKLS